MQDPLAPYKQSRIVRGALLENVPLTTGVDNRVAHTLGRACTGIIVVQQSADARVWTDQSANTEPGKYIHIQCSSDVTVSLWCF